MAYQPFNGKAILVEIQLWYRLTHDWRDKRVHTFSRDIRPKVNVMARLEIELAYYIVAVQYVGLYTTGTHLRDI